MAESRTTETGHKSPHLTFRSLNVLWQETLANCGRCVKAARCLRLGSAVARLLGLRYRIPPNVWIFVSCECCVLSGRGLCDGPITPLEESSYPGVVCRSVISKFYISLTVHFGIILSNNLLDALFSMYLFISLLYMFRTTQCSSSGESNYINTSSGMISLCR